MYDVVFKYLMEDNAVAITFLSALTGMDIVSLLPLPQELTVDAEGDSVRPKNLFGRKLSVYRLDFSARVRDREGEEKIVIVEIQQEKLYGQLMRFRKYLGKQYENSAFVKKTQTATGREYDIGIPILSIYFVGEGLEGFRDIPVVLLRRSAIAQHTMQPVDGTNPFIEALFHNGIIVNVPFLSREGRNELEALLSIFSPLNQTTNPQIMSIQETKFMEKYQPILRRLKAAAQEKGVRDKMTVEDDFLEEMEYLERNHEERMRRLDEKELRLDEKELRLDERERGIDERGRSVDERMRKAEEEARKAEEEAHKAEEEARKAEEEKRKAEEEKRKAEEEKRKAEEEAHMLKEIKEKMQQQQGNAIRLLLDLGMSKAEIAIKLGLSEVEMEQD